MNELTIILPLLTGLVGWLLNEVSHRRREVSADRRAISKALADLLEIRHQTVAMKSLFDTLTHRLNLPQSIWSFIFPFLESFWPNSDGLHKRYNDTVDSVASANPMLGFRLRSKDELTRYLKSLRQLASQHYTELKPVFLKYSADERTVQAARNGLLSFTRIFHNDLVELEKSWRYIDSSLNQANDSTANTRTGLTGGSIGAIIGSIVFPGLGTIAGGALGGYLMTKNRTDNLLSQATTHIDNYANHTRHLIKLLHDNAKELYLLAGRMYDQFQVRKLRSSYFELKKSRADVEQVFNEYLDYHLKDVQSFYSTQISDNDTATWGQAAEYVFNFVKNYQPST